MKILLVLYYRFFLFYKDILKEEAPQFSAILTLSLCEALIIIAIVNTFCLYKYCYQLPTLLEFFFVFFMLGLNALFFFKHTNVKKVIQQKPKLINDTISSIFAWLFFILAMSWLFWGPIIGREILDHCKCRISTITMHTVTFQR